MTLFFRENDAEEVGLKATHGTLVPYFQRNLYDDDVPIWEYNRVNMI